MTPGLTRKQATVELTRDTLDNDAATASPIEQRRDLADGRYLAITTRADPLRPCRRCSCSASRARCRARRSSTWSTSQDRTLERVTHSYSRGRHRCRRGQKERRISADGERLAFASFAGNLFFGDANQRADAFVATRQPDPDAGPPDKGPGAGGPAGTIEVDREARRSASGPGRKPAASIELTVSVPAAGGVKARRARRAPASPASCAPWRPPAGAPAGTARSTVTPRPAPGRPLPGRAARDAERSPAASSSATSPRAAGAARASRSRSCSARRRAREKRSAAGGSEPWSPSGVDLETALITTCNANVEVL